MRDREGAVDTLLTAMAETSTPVGTRTARAALSAAGYSVSESSASRLLTELDERGYSTPVGRKGRVLSPAGRRRAQEVEQARKAADRTSQVTVRDVADLLDLLRTRRVIESAVAADAALHADATSLAALRASHVAHADALGSDLMKEQPGLDLHRMIARMCRNRPLATVADVVLAPQLDNIEAVLDIVLGAHQKDTDVLDQHGAVIDAIAAGDPERAETAMREHLDSMIDDVETFIVGGNERVFIRLLSFLDATEKR